MQSPETQKTTLAILLLGLALLLAPLTVGAEDSWTLYGDGGYWLDALTQEVRIADSVHGNFQPYLGQLQVMAAAFRRGDEITVYAAMDRFMDMLENRENGISEQKAHWLFDYCHLVTPAKYHEIWRRPGR